MASRPFQRLDSPGPSLKGVPLTITVFENDQNSDEEHAPEASDQVYRDKIWNRWWILEIGAFVACVLTYICAVVLLVTTADHPIPSWDWKGNRTIFGKTYKYHYHLNLNLNSVLSILATIMKATLLLPVAAGLCQLKWTWFRDTHPLTDFQAFDAASRGPFGSIMLIWYMRGRRLACLGALIVVATLSLDFAVQSIVTYPSQSVELPVSRAAAAISVATNYQEAAVPQLSGFVAGASGVVAGMLGAIYAGLYDIQGTFQLSPSCLTGNCAWPSSYSSLGVCNICKDVTKYMTMTCAVRSTYLTDSESISVPYCNYTLPNGHNISGIPNDDTGQLSMFTASNTAEKSITIPQMKFPLSVISMISAQWVTKTASGQIVDEFDGPYWQEMISATATECGLYACVKHYDSTVVNGTFVEAVSATFQNNSAGTTEDDSMLPYTTYCVKPPKYFTNTSSQHQYSLDGFAVQGMRLTLSGLWPGTVNGQIGSGNTQNNISSDLTGYLQSLSFKRVNKTFDNLAQSMTNHIRAVADELAVGVASHQVTIVSVAWRWLALPATLMGLTLIFLLAAMHSSAQSGAMLWKSSSLATFYHPLTSEGRGRVGAATGPKHLEKIAGDLEVKWERTVKGWRLVPKREK